MKPTSTNLFGSSPQKKKKRIPNLSFALEMMFFALQRATALADKKKKRHHKNMKLFSEY